jgi:hypothetical protein
LLTPLRPPASGRLTSASTSTSKKQNNVRRTPTAASRAAGVSPPWYRKPHLPVRFRKVAGVCQRWDHEPRCSRGSESTGADAPRSWWFCDADIHRRNCDLCNTRTLVYKSGGREPAVVRESRRQHRTFLVERGCSHATGGLRPPLLVVLRYGHLPAKLRLVRYTNARLQERRASARRGSGNALVSTLPHSRGSLSTVRSRTPVQSRKGIHGG